MRERAKKNMEKKKTEKRRTKRKKVGKETEGALSRWLTILGHLLSPRSDP